MSHCAKCFHALSHSISTTTLRYVFILCMRKTLAQGHTPSKEFSQDSNPGSLTPESSPGLCAISSVPCGISKNPSSLGDQTRGTPGLSVGTLSFPSGSGLHFTGAVHCKDSDPKLQQRMTSISVKYRHWCERKMREIKNRSPEPITENFMQSKQIKRNMALQSASPWCTSHLKKVR